MATHLSVPFFPPVVPSPPTRRLARAAASATCHKLLRALLDPNQGAMCAAAPPVAPGGPCSAPLPFVPPPSSHPEAATLATPRLAVAQGV